MATLVTLRTRVLDRLRETTADSHFTDSQITSFLNEAQEFVAALGSAPDKNNISSPIAVTVAGTSDYTNPSDDLFIQTAYFGTRATANDIEKLIIVTKRTIADLVPNWLDSTSGNYGQPKYIFRKDKSTLTLVPAPSSTYVGKNIYLFYGNIPTAMVSDSDSPDIAIPYHNVLVPFACRLAYYSLTNPEMAREMMSAFENDYKAIQMVVDKEAEELLAFKWGIVER